MNQCVPSWDLGDNSAPSKIKFHNHSNSPQDVPSLDYEVAEPTWENGQLAMHGLGVPRVVNKPAASNCPPTWEKPRAGGTLESIVSQATCYPLPMPRAGGSSSVTVTMDALVPCNTNNNQERPTRCSTRVGSCSGAAAPIDGGAGGNRVSINRCQTNGSVSESATCGRRDSHTQRSLDTWERELGLPGFTSTSLASTENTFSGHTKTSGGDDRDSISHHSRSQASDRKTDDEEGKRRDNGKSSVSTKRSRAAAIHNQSERKRRDKINQRMKTLQKLVPNSSKTDKASMLDEVIEYLKQMQAQVSMMSRINLPSLMLPLAMQQQLQMSMMGMGMGTMGMGMGVMDMNTMNRPTAVQPAFMPPPGSLMPDPLAACQSQPMTTDAYSRLAAMYQQLQQQPGSKT